MLFKKCLHQWEVKSNKILKSAYEQVDTNGHIYSLKRPPNDFFSITHICIMVCTKCGKVDKTITRS